MKIVFLLAPSFLPFCTLFYSNFCIVLHARSSITTPAFEGNSALRHVYGAKFMTGYWKIGSTVLTVFRVVCHVERHEKLYLLPVKKFLEPSRSNVIDI